MIPLTATMNNGMYIKIRFSLCHNPSLAMAVFANSSLSDITNSAKKTRAATKHMILITPITDSLFLKDRIAINSGTKRNSMNPMTEPAPCIFDAVVTTSLVSFTLKKHVNMQAPIANTVTNAIKVYVSPPDTEW